MRRFHWLRVGLFSAVLTPACATSSAPLKIGESTWMITGSDAWAMSSENAVIERLTRQAQQHCAGLGQTMELVDAQSSKPYGHPAEGRVTYACMAADEETPVAAPPTKAP